MQVEHYCMSSSNTFLSIPGEISVLIYILFSFFLFLFFFFLVVRLLMPFFLVSALAEASDEVTGWRKWTRGNWVGKRLRPWVQNEKTWLHLVRWESKTGAQWSSEEMGGPQCTSHILAQVMPPTLNFSYYFFSTSFIMLSIFFQYSSLYACFNPRLDSACGGQGLHFPHRTNWKTQVPEAAQGIFFLRTSVHGL